MNIDYANQLKKVHEERNKKHFDWWKNVILMASGLLGILVSLHSVKSENFIDHLLFFITLLLIGTGILSGTIYLYADIDVYNDHLKILEREQNNKSPNEANQETEVHYAGIKLIFVLMKYVAFFSFGLSIPFLIAYATSLDG
jgi:hypothetical protein